MRELVERLNEEAHRLSYQSLEHGSADSGIAANLATAAADIITEQDATITQQDARIAELLAVGTKGADLGEYWKARAEAAEARVADADLHLEAASLSADPHRYIRAARAALQGRARSILGGKNG